MSCISIIIMWTFVLVTTEMNTALVAMTMASLHVMYQLGDINDEPNRYHSLSKECCKKKTH